MRNLVAAALLFATPCLADPPPAPPTKCCTATLKDVHLSIAEWQAIISVVRQFPFDDAAPVLSQIVSQVKPQAEGAAAAQAQKK